MEKCKADGKEYYVPKEKKELVQELTERYPLYRD